MQGFSLTEILVAVAIMGLLIGLVGPTAMYQLQASRTKTAEAQIAQLQSALDIYQIDMGRYPSETEGMRGLVVPPSGSTNWNGPYLRASSVPADPWGNEYRYFYEGRRPVIESLGADGLPGGDDDDADLRG